MLLPRGDHLSGRCYFVVTYLTLDMKIFLWIVHKRLHVVDRGILFRTEPSFAEDARLGLYNIVVDWYLCCSTHHGACLKSAKSCFLFHGLLVKNVFCIWGTTMNSEYLWTGITNQGSNYSLKFMSLNHHFVKIAIKNSTQAPVLLLPRAQPYLLEGMLYECLRLCGFQWLPSAPF